ncbi:MAG: glycosyltransferase [Thermodesulfobacteriota bacterium]
MTESSGKQACVFYAAGPGDVVKTFQTWDSGIDDPHQVAVTYSGQFFQACKELGVKGVAISSNPRIDSLRTDQFVVENRPKGPQASGVSYHRQQLSYARSLVKKAKIEGACAIIAAESTGHLFSLGWFAPKSMALIPTIHCTLWPKYKELDNKQQLLNFFNRRLFCKRARGMLCISEDIRRQLELIGGNNLRPVHRFRPCYRKGTFDDVPPPSRDSDKFHILFAGRLEENKGIFDLLQICQNLKPEVKEKVIWDLAGDGSREGELRSLVEQQGVGDIFRVHGYCHRPKMLKLITDSHAFIVPTKKDFEEGFNKVVAESILNNRPVLTSSVCPAIDDVRPAVVEARPDNLEDYRKGVERLVEDRDYYNKKQLACLGIQAQFYDPANSWRAKMKLIIKEII